jgi:hypothetical protein
MNNYSLFYFSFKESDNNMETIRQSYLNAVNELNQELLATKEQYEQLDAEKRLLNNRSDQQNASQIIGKYLNNLYLKYSSLSIRIFII